VVQSGQLSDKPGSDSLLIDTNLAYRHRRGQVRCMHTVVYRPSLVVTDTARFLLLSAAHARIRWSWSTVWCTILHWVWT